MAQKESGGRSCWAITAGVLSTIQGGCYLALALAALALYYCKIEVNTSVDVKPEFLLYFIYFYNPECRESLGSSVGPQPITWPDEEFSTATLTWQWAIAYCAINGLWIFTSLFLTISGASSSKNGVIKTALPSLWLISTLAVLVADVVAVVMYGLDLDKVLKEDSEPLAALLNLSSMDPIIANYLKQVKNPEASYSSIAIIIAVARGGILWILNLILFFGVLVSTIKSNKSSKAAPKKVKNQRPPVPAAATSPDNHGNFSWHQSQGGIANPAYDARADQDVYAVSKKQKRPRDADILAAEVHTHQELRNQRPWSYLDPAPEELEQVRRRPRTPPAEEWSFSPESTLKLPRATLGHPQPSAPYPSQHQSHQFYHYPYPEQHYGNRYLDTAGRHNPYLK